MQCEACRKDAASVHYFEKVNGSGRTLALCANCAAGKGVEVLATAAAEAAWGSRPAPGGALDRGRRCPSCRLDEAGFVAGQAYRCPVCRDTFLMPSQPQFALGFAFAQRLAGLKWDLEQAVLREDFEAAARLRDALAALEQPGTAL